MLAALVPEDAGKGSYMGPLWHEGQRGTSMLNFLLSTFRAPKPTPEDLWREAFKERIAERTHIFGDELDDVVAAEMESWLEDEDYLEYNPAFAADESLSYWGD